MERKSGYIKPKAAEDRVKMTLQREFGQEFTKQSIKIGNEDREFDLVSDDNAVIAQVKTCQKKSEDINGSQRVTRYKRYIFDCLLLDMAPKPAKHRIFYLFADKSEFKKFQEWSLGLISPKVEVKFRDAWK